MAPSRHRIAALAAVALLVLCAPGGSAAAWDEVAFRHDFDESGTPDPAVWIVNHPGFFFWVQGRTQFPDPGTTTGPFPSVAGGVCTLEHHLYNPWDLAEVNLFFLGGEIRTVREFEPDRAWRIEARVKSDAYPDGLVTSFFSYGFDGSNADELDFEFVSNATNDEATWPGSDPVLTNTWNETVEKPEYVAPAGLDLTEWNTFRIYWDPVARRVDWTWLDPVAGETWLRSETVASAVPDESMQVYFNFWAPAATWPDAYSVSLEPVSDPGQNVIHRYRIDWIEVRTQGEQAGPTPVPVLPGGVFGALALTLIVAACTRRRKPDHFRPVRGMRGCEWASSWKPRCSGSSRRSSTGGTPASS